MNYRLNPYNSYVSSQPFFFKEKAPNSKSFYSSGPNVVNQLNCDASKQLVGGPQYGITNALLTGRKFCNSDTDQYVDVQGKSDDVNLMTVGNLKINENLSAFAEAAFTDSKRTYRSASRTILGTSPTTNYLVGGLAAPFQQYCLLAIQTILSLMRALRLDIVSKT